MAALSLLPYAGPLAAAREWGVVLVESLAPGQIAGSLWSTLGQPFPWVAWVWVGLLVWGLVAAVAAWRRDRSAAALFRLLVLPAAGLAQYGLFLVIGYPPRIWYFLPGRCSGTGTGTGPAAGRCACPAAGSSIRTRTWPSTNSGGGAGGKSAKLSP